MRKPLVVLLLAAGGPAYPDWFSFGVKGGVPLTTAFRTATSQDLRYLSSTKRYTVGPVVEVRSPFWLGAEINALYKRLRYDSTQTGGANPMATATTANSWEFPLLLKVRSPGRMVRSYFSAGPSFRHLSGLRQSVTSLFTGRVGEALRPSELENRFASGFAVAGGLEIGEGLRVAPEIRYTRWGWENFRAPAGAFRTNLNQLDFLLGIHF